MLIVLLYNPMLNKFLSYPIFYLCCPEIAFSPAVYGKTNLDMRPEVEVVDVAVDVL